MFPASKEFDVTATTFSGLEDALISELRTLGIKDPKKGSRAVTFKASEEQVIQVNLALRSALKILIPLKSFPVRNENDLYRHVQQIDWTSMLETYDTFAIEAVVHSPFFNHSKYVVYKVKDAIVDQFKDKFGKRPSVDPDRPDLHIHVRIHHDKATVSLNSSGESLHRRGYREGDHPSPINEVLAAGMVLLSNWDKESEFIDPMCGSGTIAIEAALIALNIYPNIDRVKFGFHGWKQYDAALFNKVKDELETRKKPFQSSIMASDSDKQMLSIARKNINNAGLSGKIETIESDISELVPMEEQGCLVINPPYGERFKDADLEGLYKRIGDVLKQNFSGYNAWIISSNLEAMKRIGLKPSKKYTLYNGPLECKYFGYSLFSGSLKDHKRS